MTTDFQFHWRMWSQRRPYLLLVGISLALLAVVSTGRTSEAAPLQPSPQREPETFICMDVTEIPYSQCVALFTLYNETNGPNWTNHTDWGTTTTPCSWYGVTCQDGQVTQINLPSNGLDGIISSVIAELPALQKLVLPYNQLHGTIPPELGTLQDLQLLHLVGNQLSGAIPASFGNLTELYQLSLDANQLSGPIPAELGNLPHLRELRLTYNQLSGEIPAALGNLSTLQGLMLAQNRLEGAIPPELGNLSNLILADFSGNALRGEIPAQLVNWGEMSYFKLDYNALTATNPALVTWLDTETPGWEQTQTVPPTDVTLSAIVNGSMIVTWKPIIYTADSGSYEIWYTTDPAGSWSIAGQTADKTSEHLTITGLDVSSTYYVRIRTHSYKPGYFPVTSEFSPVVSTTPQSICSTASEIPQSECEALLVVRDSLVGTNWQLTTSPCNWEGILCEEGHVRGIGIADTLQGGIVSPSVGNLPKLRFLVLPGNHLHGILPTELGNLTELETLQFYNNDLEGPLPPSLGNLTKVMAMIMHTNHFSGQIPAALGNMSALTWLHLEENELTGPLPPQLGNLPSLFDLGLADNQITGEIPPELGNIATLGGLILGNNRLSGAIPAALGNLVNLSTLTLDGNQLSGNIPSTLMNLNGIDQISFDYNMLQATDPVLRNWLDQISPNWQATQTVPPTNIHISQIVNGQATVTWTPITYSGQGGNYEINLTTDPSSIWSVVTTANKSANSFTFTGLTPNTYFVRMRTTTFPHASNQNTLTSNFSTIVESQGDFNCADVTEIPQSECEALVALYNSTNGPGWTNGSGWLIASRPCSWNGITCDMGHVTKIELGENELAGQIPSQLADLTKLQVLHLYQNQLTGPIPTELGNLHDLTSLSLAINQLSGFIPTELGNLANLQGLGLGMNQLSGSIPPELGNLTHLEGLALDTNQLSGSIPAELANIPNLFSLVLDDNLLTGSIPPELGILQNLYTIGLSGNQLSGPIPTELANLANLRLLLLSGNHFSGSIPPELGNLGNLRRLYIGNNHFSGTIPPELGNLSRLESLSLSQNQLTGTIPQELGNLSSLTQLALYGNQLRGEIPLQITQLRNLFDKTFLFDYNALTARESAVLAWLDQFAPDWQTTQTVPPTDISLVQSVNGALAISWKPIPYTGNSGYYEISYATRVDGPFTVYGHTTDKTVSSDTLTGLPPGNAYYIRMRTFTPAHERNPNDLWSDYSEVVQTQGGTTPTNLLQNGSFESGTAPWIFFTNGQGTFTTAGPAYAGNAAARVEIIETGSNTQLYQTGFVLEPRTRYRLRFAAYSSSGHDLSLYVQQHQSPYTNYGLRNFRLNLTTGWQEFSVEFRTKNFTMPTDDTRLRLWFKPYATGGDVYWIDNIVLEKIDARSTTASTSGDIVDTIVGAVQLPVGHTEPITLTLVDLETEGETLTRTTTTVANGAFQFTDLPTGIYELKATPPQGLLASEPYQFMIGESEHEEFVFVMEPVVNLLYLPLVAR